MVFLPVKGLISGFFDFSMDLVENGGFGASPIRTSVASFPAVFSFLFCLCHFCEKMILCDFPMIFLRNDY